MKIASSLESDKCPLIRANISAQAKALEEKRRDRLTRSLNMCISGEHCIVRMVIHSKTPLKKSALAKKVSTITTLSLKMVERLALTLTSTNQTSLEF